MRFCGLIFGLFPCRTEVRRLCLEGLKMVFTAIRLVSGEAQSLECLEGLADQPQNDNAPQAYSTKITGR